LQDKNLKGSIKPFYFKTKKSWCGARLRGSKSNKLTSL
jgi:hypothetical protein